MADPIGSLVGSLLGGGDGGGLGEVAGELLGGGGGDLLGGVLGGGGFDPESMAVDFVGKLLGLDTTELGVCKAALGAVTGDPMAIASGVEETIQGIATGQSPFADKSDAPNEAEKKADEPSQPKPA